MSLAVKFCKELGIDDPITWYNAVDPKVIDLWIAYELFINSDADKMAPADGVLAGLAKKHVGDQWPTTQT